MDEYGGPGQPSCVIEEIEDEPKPDPQNKTETSNTKDKQPEHHQEELQEEHQHEPIDSSSDQPAGTLNAADASELRGESWGRLGPLLPPADGCEKVTEDGGVLKKVLVEGFGDAPKQYARCLGALKFWTRLPGMYAVLALCMHVRALSIMHACHTAPCPVPAAAAAPAVY